jgi:light-regulated signal transduction histidine kinase (bacteriophytochrome)
LIVLQSRTRTQAVSLAEAMTANLQQRERELRRANDDIVRSNKELERYASIAAHDLQEPLRSLLAYASVLERRYGETLEPEVLDQVKRMARAAERMRSLVVDLLAYAKADSAKRRIEWVDLNEAIRIAIDDLSVLIHETGATIRVADLPRVPGNRRELIGVFSNLLSNALKYRSESPPEVIVVAHERNDEWVLGVKDNGIGIDEAYHERIFELFRRLEKRSSDSGTGLGLAICARTIAQHGGRIWVESEEGRGSTFWFTLPAKASVSTAEAVMA